MPWKHNARQLTGADYTGRTGRLCRCMKLTSGWVQDKGLKHGLRGV